MKKFAASLCALALAAALPMAAFAVDSKEDGVSMPEDYSDYGKYTYSDLRRNTNQQILTFP